MQRLSSRVVDEGDPSALRLASDIIHKKGFIVAPTDTIYGILADALSYRAVRRLKKIRRPSGRPFLVLLPDSSWVGKLGLVTPRGTLRLLSVRGLTVVMEKRVGLYHWLGSKTIAVRVPGGGFIFRLLRKVGRPLVAPSANPEGKPPARSIEEAVRYFGDKVSLYVDGGRIEGRPSTVVRLGEGGLEIIRRGSLNVESLNRILGRITLLPLRGLSPFLD